MKKHRHPLTGIWILVTAFVLAVCIVIVQKRLSKEVAVFSFDVAADMRQFADPNHQSSRYFMGACQAIRDIGKGAFMVSPGDIDPPQYVHDTIEKVLGDEYPWYPVVGNHEAETPQDMQWLRDWGGKNIPNLVRRGPENCEETTYSFDYENAHFVVINQYYDGQSDTTCEEPKCKGADGDICDALYEWLKNDLQANSKPFVFVFGHEPMMPLPDADNGRLRHLKNSLNAHPENNHRFQMLLRKHKVTAYICGHTHTFSFAKINGLWQIDAGHSHGIGDPKARSTFLKIRLGGNRCRVDVYRDDANGGPYSLTRTIVLN